MDFWLKVALAVVLGLIAIRLWPVANHLVKHGPKGNADDWRAAVVPLLLVIGFVFLLIVMVRG